MNEVKSYMNQKGVEYRTINKSRSRRIYERLKAHIAPPKHTIQVLGTNGKGSTGRFLALMLMQNGANVVHFTSPHIFSFSERFYKNGAIIGDDELKNAHRFLQGFDFMAECSYFEYATFLAAVLAQGVDYLILEAGVGGELDSTSVIARDLCVFSVIDYDHTEILGDSIEKIATTKLNAVFYPNRVPKMVVGAQKYKIVEKIAREIAEKNNITLYFGNSPLELHSADFGIFEASQTPSLVSAPKIPKNYESQTENPSVVLNANSTDSSLRGVANAEAIQKNQITESRPIRGAKNRIQTSSSASADFLLESGKRGSPPKSEKWQPLGTQFKHFGGAEAGGAAILRKEKGESQSKKIVGDSQVAKMDSSLTAFAQNDEFIVDCFGDELPRNDGVKKYLQNHHLAGFLRQNLILALKALEILGLKCDLETLPKLDLRGRFEQIAPNIIIDVGHNQNAAFAVKQNLGQKKVILVYNSYFQKNISEILGILKDNILRVEILEVADNPRIIERKTLEKTLDSLGILYQNFNGVDFMDSQNDYLVFGSFSVVEAFMREFMSGAK